MGQEITRQTYSNKACRRSRIGPDGPARTSECAPRDTLAGILQSATKEEEKDAESYDKEAWERKR